MQDSKMIPTWKSWLKIGRLIPLLTILAAAIVGILSLLGRFQVTMAEGVIIALLTLLSIDALVERMSFLEKIDSRLERLPESEILRDRSNLIRMEHLAVGATEIWAAGISLVSILHPYYDFYLQKLKEGCNLRFLLLEPNSIAREVWDKAQRVPTTKKDIETSLQVIDNITKSSRLKGKCEARRSQFQLPFSLVIVDSQKERGRMIVELLAYKRSLPDRLHLYLTRRNHEKWFMFFYNQFESLWHDSSIRQTEAEITTNIRV